MSLKKIQLTPEQFQIYNDLKVAIKDNKIFKFQEKFDKLNNKLKKKICVFFAPKQEPKNLFMIALETDKLNIPFFMIESFLKINISIMDNYVKSKEGTKITPLKILIEMEKKQDEKNLENPINGQNNIRQHNLYQYISQLNFNNIEDVKLLNDYFYNYFNNINDINININYKAILINIFNNCIDKDSKYKLNDTNRKIIEKLMIKLFSKGIYNPSLLKYLMEEIEIKSEFHKKFLEFLVKNSYQYITIYSYNNYLDYLKLFLNFEKILNKDKSNKYAVDFLFKNEYNDIDRFLLLNENHIKLPFSNKLDYVDKKGNNIFHEMIIQLVKKEDIENKHNTLKNVFIPLNYLLEQENKEGKTPLNLIQDGSLKNYYKLKFLYILKEFKINDLEKYYKLFYDNVSPLFFLENLENNDDNLYDKKIKNYLFNIPPVNQPSLKIKKDDNNNILNKIYNHYKNNINGELMVIFENQRGVNAGGLSRALYDLVSDEIKKKYLFPISIKEDINTVCHLDHHLKNKISNKMTYKKNSKNNFNIPNSLKTKSIKNSNTNTIKNSPFPQMNTLNNTLNSVMKQYGGMNNIEEKFKRFMKKTKDTEIKKQKKNLNKLFKNVYIKKDEIKIREACTFINLNDKEDIDQLGYLFYRYLFIDYRINLKLNIHLNHLFYILLCIDLNSNVTKSTDEIKKIKNTLDYNTNLLRKIDEKEKQNELYDIELNENDKDYESNKKMLLREISLYVLCLLHDLPSEEEFSSIKKSIVYLNVLQKQVNNNSSNHSYVIQEYNENIIASLKMLRKYYFKNDNDINNLFSLVDKILFNFYSNMNTQLRLYIPYHFERIFSRINTIKKEELKNLCVFTNDSNDKFKNVLFEIIDDESTNEEEIKNMLINMTGSLVFDKSKNLKFNLYSSIDRINFHTCFYSVDIPEKENYDKDVIKSYIFTKVEKFNVAGGSYIKRSKNRKQNKKQNKQNLKTKKKIMKSKKKTKKNN